MVNLRNIRWGAVAVLLTLVFGSLTAESRQTEVQTFAAQPGDMLLVQNDFGRVSVRAAADSQVRVVVQKRGREARDLDEVTLVGQKSGSRIFLNGYFYDYQGQSLDLEVEVPAWLQVVIWGANPDVWLRDLEGRVQVYTQTGRVEAWDLRSSSTLQSSEGDLFLYQSVQPEGDLRLESDSGLVLCEVSPDLNLKAWLRGGGGVSWNGEFEMPVGQLEKTLGVGGPLLYAASLGSRVQVLLQSPEPSVTLPQVVEPAVDDEPAPTSESREPQPEPGGGRPIPGDVAGGPPPAGSEQYSLKVNVDWTRLNVSVRDRRTNRNVPNLQKRDFQVYEDGQLQSIETFETVEAPFDLLLLLDVSGSTSAYLDLIKEASIEFTRQIKSNDQIAVAAFNTSTQLIQPFTNNRTRVARAIQGIHSGGGTAFYDALDISLESYMRGREGRKAIVVFSDGVDNQLTGDWGNGSRTTFERLYRRVEDADSIIYTIFLDTEGSAQGSRRRPRRRGTLGGILGDILNPRPRVDEDAYREARRQLQQISDQTGGRLYSPSDIYDLRNVYGEIADDLRIQYSLIYSSNNLRADGKWRRIQVRVNGRNDLVVRTRKGYYAPRV